MKCFEKSGHGIETNVKMIVKKLDRKVCHCHAPCLSGTDRPITVHLNARQGKMEHVLQEQIDF